MLLRPLPWLVPLLLFAGCLGGAEPATGALAAQDGNATEPEPTPVAAVAPPARFEPEAPRPSLVSGNLTVHAPEPLRWMAELDAEGDAEDEVPFNLTLPEGFEATHEGRLVVSLRWPLYEEKWYTLEVRDAAGDVVAQGEAGDAALGLGPVPVLPVPGSAAVAVIDAPPEGAYVVVVKATRGAGPYEGAVHFESRPLADAETPRDLLPNLVTLPPMDLQVGGGLFGLPDVEGAPARGCDPDETAETRALRCLRFSNGIGNVGEGPLEMRLSKEEGAKALAGLGGRFAQRVSLSDGSSRDVEAGAAEFHPAHGHFHYSGAATFAIHAYDLETQARGEALREGRKTGFCFADLSLVLPGLTVTTAPRFDASGCLDPLTHDAWVTGLSPNWYDRYHWTWFDQYVDVTELPDGVYELVSTANVEGLVLETTTADNEASAVFRLTGDRVEVLRTSGPVPAAP